VLLRPLDDELAALMATTERRLLELEAESTNRRRELELLNSGGAVWRTELRQDMEVVARRLHKEVDRLLAGVWARCDAVYVPEAILTGDLLRLSERLKGDLGLTAGTLGELIRRRSAQVLRDFTARHGLDLSSPRIDALPAPDVLPISTLPAATSASRFMQGARGFSEGSDVGQKVGSAIGAVVDFVIPGSGLLVGGFLGKVVQTVVAVFSAREAVESYTEADQQERIATLRSELASERDRHREDLVASVDDLIEETRHSVSADLDNRVEGEIATVDESLRRLASVQKQTSLESERRRSEIEGERAPLRRVLAEVDDLAGQALHLGSR